MSHQEVNELPPIFAYPPNSIRHQIQSPEWESCLQIWIESVELRLRIPEDRFSKVSLRTSGILFLLSYLSERNATLNESAKDSTASRLDRLCYLLLKRVLTCDLENVNSSLYFDLLSLGSTGYGTLKSWKSTLKSIWTRQAAKVKKAIESAKTTLMTSTSSEQQRTMLAKFSDLTKALPEIATLTMAGADYLDVLNEIYKNDADMLKRAATANAFYSFIALLHIKQVTILTDDIYHIKSEADRLQKSSPSTTTLLSSLLCTTSFLRHFISNSEVATRKQTLVQQLSTYRDHMLHLHPRPPLQRKSKGKTKAKKDESIHIHKAAQVSQVHELFPNLGTDYILKVLDYFEDDVESAIAALLEPDALPESLKDQTASDDSASFDVDHVDLAPRSSPLFVPERKNVFDNDDFDRLQISSNQIIKGKKDIHTDLLKGEEGHARSKAAILSALAAFDSDDDERDDTYDVADVGGAVDNTVDTDERRSADVNEEALFKLWKESADAFSRDSKTRASNMRQQLKRETGMSDEQIEGWAIMLKKDTKMAGRLEDKYSDVRAFRGGQANIESTKWRATPSAENSEVDSGPERSNDTRRQGQAGIRGHRNFGRGRGNGNVAASGPPSEAATQAARKRKEQGRGRGGANSRRDARARKVGRGMGTVPS